MATVQLTAETLPLAPSRTVVLALTIAVVTAAFYCIEHRNNQVSNLEAFTLTGDEMSERAAEGDVVRRIAIPLLGCFGAILLVRREGPRLSLRSRLGWLLLGYLAWCGMSVLWSTDPSLTMRRLSVLFFCSMAALGIARHLTLKELCVTALGVTTLLLMNALRIEMLQGNFHPFSLDYRFAGTLHPNAQSPNCATMALAAGCLAYRAKRGRAFLWGLCLFGITLLLLTKSRTVCGALIFGILAFSLYRASWEKRIIAAGAIVLLGCTVALAAGVVGFDIEDKVVNTLLIGRQDEAESLTGRIPLWSELVPYAQNRFFLGHGYSTFWSSQRIESFSRAFQWTVPDGHSAYLDAFLDLGLVGTALCLAAVGSGIRLLFRRYMSSGDVGYGFLLSLLVCRSFSGLLESAFATPTILGAFIMVCGFAHLGYRHDSEAAALGGSRLEVAR